MSRDRAATAARPGTLTRAAFGVTGLLALLLPLSTADATGKPPAGLSISEHFRCPAPFHRGLVTIEPSGAATLVVTRGLDPQKGRSTIHKKRLSREEVKELTTVMRESGYEFIPETTFDGNRERHRRKDTCNRSIEITLDGKTRRIRFDGGYDNPPALDVMLKGIRAILDRHEWEVSQLLGPAVSPTAPADTSPVAPIQPPTGSVPVKPTPLEPPRPVCPPTKYVNCMPPVPEHMRPMCSLEYLQWMKVHCPGAEVVY